MARNGYGSIANAMREPLALFRLQIFESEYATEVDEWEFYYKVSPAAFDSLLTLAPNRLGDKSQTLRIGPHEFTDQDPNRNKHNGS